MHKLINVFTLAVAALFVVTVSIAADARNAPQSPSISSDAAVRKTGSAQCSVSYALAPGERSVRSCQYKPFRYLGIVVVESGSEFVDAGLVKRIGNGFLVISVTNRSAEVVSGTALVEIY